MKKVLESIGLAAVKGDFGVEIEVEGNHLMPIQNHIWNTEDDRSLRGRFPDQRSEYVFKNPLKYGQVQAALEMLQDHQRGAKLDFSFRTSVHVHLNVQQLTEPQLKNVIYTYLLVEDLMMKFCGRERIGNRFCLRLQDAEGFMETVTMLFQKDVKYFIEHIHGDEIRYSSLNLAALAKYGSLEFRGMRGTLDIKTLMTWITAINNIRNYAMGKQDPSDIYEEYSDTDYLTFVQKVLGDVSESFLYPGYENDIARSFSLTIELPHIYRLYHGQNQPVEEKKAEKKLKVDVNNIGIGHQAILMGAFAGNNPIRWEDIVQQDRAVAAPRRPAIHPMMIIPDDIDDIFPEPDQDD